MVPEERGRATLLHCRRHHALRRNLVSLCVPEAVIERRLLHRAAQEGRSDDTAAVIRDRLDVCPRATSPLIAYHRDRGILLEVDADRPPEAVTSDILTRPADRSPIRDTT
jgi:adenylate kinase